MKEVVTKDWKACLSDPKQENVWKKGELSYRCMKACDFLKTETDEVNQHIAQVIKARGLESSGDDEEEENLAKCEDDEERDHIKRACELDR